MSSPQPLEGEEVRLAEANAGETKKKKNRRGGTKKRGTGFEGEYLPLRRWLCV